MFEPRDQRSSRLSLSNLLGSGIINQNQQIMRIEYSELMEKLGVGHNLCAYETRPWFLHDPELGVMCSAEVRVGPGVEDIEAEIQFLYDNDNPPPPEPEPEEKPLPIIRYGCGGEEDIYEDDGRTSSENNDEEKEKKPKRGPILWPNGPEQIMLMRFTPNKNEQWQGVIMFVKGEEYHGKIGDWDTRGCAFFFDFISALQMNEMPDLEELIEEHLVDRQRRGRRGRRGRVGKKGFKVEQKGMTMGMGMGGK